MNGNSIRSRRISNPSLTLNKGWNGIKIMQRHCRWAPFANAWITVFRASDITHLMTVSCTGMSAPGLDLQVMELLDLPRNIFRTSVNFMGCYAAIHALKMADAFCKSERERKCWWSVPNCAHCICRRRIRWITWHRVYYFLMAPRRH